MERHEWSERTEEGKRFFRVNRVLGKWQFLTTLKTDPDWESIESPSEELWRELRDVLWRRYQRKKCPWKFIEEIDKILGEDSTPNP